MKKNSLKNKQSPPFKRQRQCLSAISHKQFSVPQSVMLLCLCIFLCSTLHKIPGCLNLHKFISLATVTAHLLQCVNFVEAIHCLKIRRARLLPHVVEFYRSLNLNSSSLSTFRGVGGRICGVFFSYNV